MEPDREFDRFISDQAVDLAKLDKKRVLQVCQISFPITDSSICDFNPDFSLTKQMSLHARLGDPDLLNGFRFLFTRYISYLNVEDVDSLFEVYLPGLTRQLESDRYFGGTVDLIILALKNTATEVGSPNTHLGFKNLYCYTLFLIKTAYDLIKDRVKQIKECKSTNVLLARCLSFLVSKQMKFRIHSGAEEEDFFEGVIFSLGQIISSTGSFEFKAMENCCRVIESLMVDNQWKYHPRVKSSHWVNMYIELDRLHDTLPKENREPIRKIRRLLEQTILNEMATKWCLARPNCSTKYLVFQCKIIIRNENRLAILKSDGTALVDKIIHVLKETGTETSPEKVKELIVVSIIIFTIASADSALFLQLMTILSDNILQSTEYHTCDLQFSTTVQIHVIKYMSPSSMLAALKLYNKFLLKFNENNPLPPAKWALIKLVKVCFKCLSAKVKARVRQEAEQKQYGHLKTVLPLERHKFSVVVTEFVNLADKFPSDKRHFVEMTRALATLTIANTIVISGWFAQQVKERLDIIWTFLRNCPNYGFDYQWTGPFLAYLVCLSMKVNYDLHSDLQAIIQLDLPPTSATLLELVLLDYAPAVPGYPDTSNHAEQLLANEQNESVKSFIAANYRSGSLVETRIPWIIADSEIQKTFPHQCTSAEDDAGGIPKRRKLHNYKSLANIEQTVQVLKQEIRDQTPFANQDVERMRSLVIELNELLHITNPE